MTLPVQKSFIEHLLSIVQRLLQLVSAQKKEIDSLNMRVETLEQEKCNLANDRDELECRLEQLEGVAEEQDSELESLTLQASRNDRRNHGSKSEGMKNDQPDHSHDGERSCESKSAEADIGTSQSADAKESEECTIRSKGKTVETPSSESGLETDEAMAENSQSTSVEETKVAAGPPKEKKKRKQSNNFPDDLEQEVIYAEPVKECEECHSTNLRKNGGQRRHKTLEFVRRSFKLLIEITQGYECVDCGHRQWSKPFRALKRMIFGPKLVAHVICNKYLLRIPLALQSKLLRHDNLEISRSRLSTMISAAVKVLYPLYLLMQEHVLEADRIHCG